jgi:hypothetical protein
MEGGSERCCRRPAVVLADADAGNELVDDRHAPVGLDRSSVLAAQDSREQRETHGTVKAEQVRWLLQRVLLQRTW